MEAGTLLGSILLKQGNAAEAGHVLKQAVARQPDNAEIHYLLARSYQKLGQSEESVREFAEVERLQAQERAKERKPRP